MYHEPEVVAYRFKRITEVLRYQDICYSEEIGNIYAVITGNQFLLNNVEESSKRRHELEKFIVLRIIFLIESCITYITKKDKCIPEMKYDDRFTIDNDSYMAGNVLSMNELQVLEMKIKHMTEVNLSNASFNSYQNKGRRTPMTNESYDLIQMLSFLIYQFNNVVTLYKDDGFQRTGIRYQRNQDVCSPECIFSLAHLIANTLVAFIDLRNSCYPCSAEYGNGVGDIDKMKYTSMGAIHFAGALCCFKNIPLLSLAVVGNKRLGTRERDCIHDVITLSHYLDQ